jgi:hypothetical protein
VALTAGERSDWRMVADVDRDAAGVASPIGLLKRGEKLRA